MAQLRVICPKSQPRKKAEIFWGAIGEFCVEQRVSNGPMGNVKKKPQVVSGLTKIKLSRNIKMSTRKEPANLACRSKASVITCW